MSHKLTAYLFVLNLSLTQWILAILSNVCKLDNFELQNFLKFSFTNIWYLRSKFLQCESFLQSNSLDILALCETNLYDSSYSCNFSVRGYLRLIQNDSVTHTHGVAVYVNEWLFFCTGFISRKLCEFLLMFWIGFIWLNVLLQSLSFSLCIVFDSSFSYIDLRFSRSTHLLMCLYLETLMSIIRSGWPILMELIDLVNSVVIVLSQTTLLRWSSFLLGSPTVTTLTVLLFFRFLSFFWC